MGWLTRVRLLGVCAAFAFAAGCGDDDGGAAVDSGTGDGDAQSCPAACADGEACRYGVCVPSPQSCGATDECPGDFYCDLPAGECLPWGVGPGGFNDETCTRDVVAGVFFPDVQCEWLGPPDGDPFPDHRNVLGSPIVIDFKGSGDPELGRPSIVFISYNFTDGGGESCRGDDPMYTGVIRVIDGRTCQQTANISAPLPIASSSLAAGDLNGDSVPEIVAATVGGGLAAWEFQDGGTFDLLWESDTTPAAGLCVWTGPSLHDLTDDGLPEVQFYGAVFTPAGQQITDLGTLTGGSSTGYIPVIADLDGDGDPDMVDGATIYRWDNPAQIWVAGPTLGGAAQTAVADLGTYGANAADDDRTTKDGIAEIVAVASGVVTAYNLDGRVVFGPTTLPGTGFGGAPTVADFDGDGRAEFASANGTAYSVFDPDCVEPASADTCPTLSTTGVLWTQPSQDGSSNRTGSSVFDFEGDGIAEAVYGDECFTRVYDGRTGVVVYSRFRTSCTWYENPVIADTDADFGAEIVVGSNQNCMIACPAVDPIFDGIQCFDESDCPGATACRREAATDALGKCRCEMDADCGGDGFVCIDPIAGPSAEGKVCRAAHGGQGVAFGVRVIGDQLGRWVNTRRVWNQHAYAVTNILDSGAVPRTSDRERNWLDPELNNFRQNSPGEGAGAGLMPDLTVRSAEVTCAGAGAATLEIEVCNRGTEPVADGVPVAVYDGANVACTTATTSLLRPGNCVDVSCDVTGLSGDALKAIVDDDGTDVGVHTECRELNNGLLIPADC